MSIYERLPESIKTAVELHIKKGEAFKVSEPILYDNKKYHIAEYSKVMLGIKSKNINGRLAIDDNGDVVNDKFVLKELGKIFYYYDVFFMDHGADIKRAMKSDEDMNSEIKDYNDAAVTLEYMKSKNIYGAAEVKRIIEGFPEMKKESNDVLKAFSEKVKEYKGQEVPFSKAVMDDIYDIYERAMLSNFKRIKFINTASDYYDSIKDQAVKIRKGAWLKLNTDNKNKAMKLENIMAFYINVIKFYGDFVNYSVEQYNQSIIDKDKREIAQYIKSFRNFDSLAI